MEVKLQLSKWKSGVGAMVKYLPESDNAIGMPMDGTSTRRFKNHATTKTMPFQIPCQADLRLWYIFNHSTTNNKT